MGASAEVGKKQAEETGKRASGETKYAERRMRDLPRTACFRLFVSAHASFCTLGTGAADELNVMEPSTDQAAFLYYTSHPGERPKLRGEIDLNAALILLQQFNWQAMKPARDARERVAPEIAESRIGFIDAAGAELVVAFDGETFNVEFAEPDPPKRSLLGIRRSRWQQHGARTREMEDLLSLIRLLFAGRKAVIVDLLRAAECSSHIPAPS